MSNPSFISRIGLLDNLRRHLLSGRWAVMSGGPMIGKSILAAHLAERIDDDQNRAVPISLKDADLDSEFWSFLFDAIVYQGIEWNSLSPYRKKPASLSDLMTQLHHITEKTPTKNTAKKFTLLIDDCDRFLPHAGKLIPQIANMATELVQPSIHAICWIGGPAWEDWVRDHTGEFIVPLRFYPLSVVPIREARTLIQNRLGPGKVERVWNETGGHPFLLEQSFGNGNGVSTDELCRQLFQNLAPEEKTILDQLNPNGDWLILEDLKGEDGHRPAKRLLDRLCMTGIIIRTLNNGTAMIRITSPTFISKKEQ